jgi:ankyrin repeat protein
MVRLIERRSARADFLPFEATMDNDKFCMAVRRGEIDDVRAALDAGMDPSVRDPLIKTPALGLAITQGHDDVAQLLIERGADVAASSGNSALLHFAAEFSSVHIVKMMLDRGAPIHARDARLETPLHHAASRGHVDIAGALLDAGASVETACYAAGRVPLHIAAEKGNLELCALLLERGAQIDVKDERSWTSLMRATNASQFDACRFLLDGGADVNARAPSGISALQVAADNGNVEIGRMLIDYGAEIDHAAYSTPRALDKAARQGHDVFCKMLIEAGANPSIGKHSALSALGIAAASGEPDVCAVLIAMGCDLNVGSGTGNSPLHLAAQSLELEACRVLIAGGADVNFANKEHTALHAVATDSGIEIARLLVAAGADPSFVPDGVGKPYRTPFECAIVSEQFEAVRFFVLECGVDLSRRTVSGKTMIAIAKSQEMRDTLRSLKAEVSVAGAVGLSTANAVERGRSSPSPI